MNVLVIYPVSAIFDSNKNSLKMCFEDILNFILKFEFKNLIKVKNVMVFIIVGMAFISFCFMYTFFE